MPPDPNTQAISPDQLSNKLFDAALMQAKGDPREAARQVIAFLTDALIYAVVSATSGDEAMRKGLLKSVADTILTASPPLKPGQVPASPPKP